MGFFKNLKDYTARAFSGFAKRAGRALTRQAVSPLADRFLTDALLFAQQASPTEREERRAAFILERLSAMGFASAVGERGEIMVLVKADDPPGTKPFLLFADVASARWHPLASLARVDTQYARGAGLADALGVAGLLSVLEAIKESILRPASDLLLIFYVGALDDPSGEIFDSLIEDPGRAPFAALGLRGLELGGISPKPLGTYRISTRIRSVAANKNAEAPQPSAVDAAVAVARRLGGVRWDAQGDTVCRLNRIEAGLGFGHIPTEGVVDIELESASREVLEMAKNAAIATAEDAVKESGGQVEVRVVGHAPVGDPLLNNRLLDGLRAWMKELKIRIKEENVPDPTSFLTARRIPAAYLALASGTEGLEADELDIASLESGQRLLFAILSDGRLMRDLAKASIELKGDKA